MKRLGRFLPSISLILFLTTLTLVVLTSHAFAKYVSIYNFGTHSARPALFEFEVTTDEDTSIYVDFGSDAETSPIYGTRTLVRTYGFSVTTAQSEVATMLTIELMFPAKLYAKIVQNDKTQPGIWVNWKMYVVSDLGLETESLEDITDLGVIVESGGAGTWVYSEPVPEKSNPHGKDICTDFRIEFQIMNVEDTSKVKDAFIYTSKLGLNVSVTQID